MAKDSAVASGGVFAQYGVRETRRERSQRKSLRTILVHSEEEEDGPEDCLLPQLTDCKTVEDVEELIDKLHSSEIGAQWLKVVALLQREEQLIDVMNDRIHTLERAAAKKVVVVEDLAESTIDQPAVRPRDPSEPRTEASVQEARRIINIPDPAVLTDGKDPTFETWTRQMSAKMTVNQDQFPNDFSHLSYLWTRVGGLAALTLEAVKPRTSDEAFECLRETYEDPDQEEHAREKYRSLYQGRNSFNGFHTEFVRLAREGKIPRIMWATDLKAKIRATMREKLVVNGATDYQRIVQFCRRVDEVDTRTAERPRPEFANRGAAPTNGAESGPSRLSPPRGMPTWVRPDTDCYYCKGKGHVSTFCPKKQPRQPAAAAIELATTPATATAPAPESKNE